MSSSTRLQELAATRKLNQATRLIAVARQEDLEVGPREALRRIESCDGDAEEAIRRMLNGGLEARAGVPELLQYSSDRGVLLLPSSVHRLLARYGDAGARVHVYKLAAIMDAAALLGFECSQTLAGRRLSAAEGDAQQVVADFEAEYRRRADRRTAKCRVLVPPRELRARSNALAGCGCPRCLTRLTEHLQHYIAKVIALSFFARLGRDEARSEAYLELIRSAEAWTGGPNFTGFFATRFLRRVKAIYESAWEKEQGMLSLDADGVLADDEGGHRVPLGERIPDRSVDVIVIVLLRERVAEAELLLRGLRADRCREFDCGDAEYAELAKLLHIVPSKPVDMEEEEIERWDLSEAA
jgi:hypothetical protein